MSQHCRWCEKEHEPDYACPQMRAALTQLADQGIQEASAVELVTAFDETLPGTIVSAFVYKAFYTETLGVYRAGVALQPVMLDGSKHSPFIVVDNDQAIRQIARTTTDICDLAVRKARAARREAEGAQAR